MNFIEAKEKLKKIAGGDYHSLTYAVSEHTDGDIEVECRIYISDIDSFTGKTWEEVFNELEGVHVNPEIDDFEEVA